MIFIEYLWCFTFVSFEFFTLPKIIFMFLFLIVFFPDESENMIGTKNIESKDFLNFLMIPYFEIKKFALSLELNLDEEHNYDSVPKCLNAEYWDSKETP